MKIKIDTEKLENLIAEELAPANGIWEKTTACIGKHGRYQIHLVVTRNKEDFLPKSQNIVKFKK